jgi:hypothetical protein
MTWLSAKSSSPVQWYRELCAESKELSTERKHLSAEPAIPVLYICEMKREALRRSLHHDVLFQTDTTTCASLGKLEASLSFIAQFQPPPLRPRPFAFPGSSRLA